MEMLNIQATSDNQDFSAIEKYIVFEVDRCLQTSGVPKAILCLEQDDQFRYLSAPTKVETVKLMKLVGNRNASMNDNIAESKYSKVAGVMAYAEISRILCEVDSDYLLELLCSVSIFCDDTIQDEEVEWLFGEKAVYAARAKVNCFINALCISGDSRKDALVSLKSSILHWVKFRKAELNRCENINDIEKKLATLYTPEIVMDAISGNLNDVSVIEYMRGATKLVRSLIMTESIKLNDICAIKVCIETAMIKTSVAVLDIAHENMDMIDNIIVSKIREDLHLVIDAVNDIEAFGLMSIAHKSQRSYSADELSMLGGIFIYVRAKITVNKYISDKDNFLGKINDPDVDDCTDAELIEVLEEMMNLIDLK